MLVKKYEFLDEDVIKFINNVTSKNSDFNEERFERWIDLNDVKSARNPSALVNSSFLRELKKGTFKAVDFEISSAELKAKKRAFPSWMLGKEVFVGFTGDELYRYLLSSVLGHLCNSGQIAIDYKFERYLKRVDGYCSDNHINTWEALLDLLVERLGINGHIIPIQELKEAEQKALGEWKKILAALEEVPAIEKDNSEEILVALKNKEQPDLFRLD